MCKDIRYREGCCHGICMDDAKITIRIFGISPEAAESFLTTARIRVYDFYINFSIRLYSIITLFLCYEQTKLYIYINVILLMYSYMYIITVSINL